MFNNIKNGYQYAHNSDSFLKLVTKKYGNQCCNPPPEGTGIMCAKTNYIKLAAANEKDLNVVFNMVLEDGRYEVNCFYRSCLSIEEFQGMIL